MRRNLLIAQTLASCHLPATVLMIAGAREASIFATSAGVDCLALPALHKEADGQYQSRCLGMSLESIIGLRSKIIRSAVEAFRPDVFIVDNVPRGAARELDPTLDYLRLNGSTRCVLGLRDVLDDPSAVRREWSGAANEDAIRGYYDAIWVYGDPAVSDPVHEYGFAPDVAGRVRYTGYLDQRMRLKSGQVEDGDLLAALNLPPGKLALCLVGGGQDGPRLAEAFAQADLPPETNGLILTGPFMPSEVRRSLYRRAAGHPRLRVHDFVAEPTLLLDRADRVVAMGGYNTVCEVLSFGKRALVIPRVRPRREQYIRAERLRDLGLIDILHPDEVEPRALAKWLAQEVGPPPQARDMIDLDGVARLPYLLEEVLLASSQPIRRSYSEAGVQYAVR